MIAEATTIALPTRRSTIRLAQKLAPWLAAGDLLILSGPLGAGKTFFTRALCRSLGLPTSVRVTSPTFTLVHEFDTRPPIAHADLYRLKAKSEVTRLGLDEHRELGRLLVVEWGEPYVEILGGDALILRLLVEPRRAELHPRGARGSAIVESFEKG
jgi:tRNA threonylcarbamoyladenosine biosynthesis protein TsaE